MLPFRYLIREGVSGVRRTPIASTMTVVTVVTALVLVGVFWYAALNLDALVASMRRQVELEAFLSPVATESIDRLRTNVLAVPGVDSVQYVSPADAARLFEAQTGERVAALLDTNPFPASFRVALRPGSSGGREVERIARHVGALEGIDTVMYRQEMVNRIDTIADVTRRIGVIGGGIILFIAFIMTANTIRLAIYAKRNLVRTLQLVGATATFVRIPFIIEGVLHGALGAAVAIGVLAGCVTLATDVLPGTTVLAPPLIFYAEIAGAGLALGFAGSVLSVARFIARVAR